MSQVFLSFGLGLLHTTLLLGLAWLLSRWWAPFRRGNASTLVQHATVGAFVLVFAALCPIPDYTFAFLRLFSATPFDLVKARELQTARKKDVTTSRN